MELRFLHLIQRSYGFFLKFSDGITYKLDVDKLYLSEFSFHIQNLVFTFLQNHISSFFIISNSLIKTFPQNFRNNVSSFFCNFAKQKHSSGSFIIHE